MRYSLSRCTCEATQNFRISANLELFDPRASRHGSKLWFQPVKPVRNAQDDTALHFEIDVTKRTPIHGGVFAIKGNNISICSELF